MRFSIFTPSHNPKYLDDCYRSLKAQSCADWEWIVVLNGGAEWFIPDPKGDPRVRVFKGPYTNGLHGIGALKRYACDRAEGEVFVELDHDDLLHHEALAKLADAFDRHPTIGFIYSEPARFCDDGRRPEDFNLFYGWQPSRQVSDEEAGSLAKTDLAGPAWVTPMWEPTPQALNRIWFAPDHVRAWRRATYFLAGGHDARQEVCDDYSLVVRTYLVTDFLFLREPLYFYRVGQNTSGPGLRNAQIQQMQFEISNEHRLAIAETWARRKGLRLIDLCSHGNVAPGYEGMDLEAGPGEIRADLSAAWPLEDNSIGVIRAQDALEHLPDKLHTMAEIWRVLCHGGWLFSDTPSSDGQGADMDPTHRSRWNRNSFWYWTRQISRSFLPAAASSPHFQCWQLETLYYSDWYRQHGIPYVRAHLSAIKDGPRLPGAYDLEAMYCG